MTEPAITVYTTGWCPYCQRVRQLLAGKNLTFTEINVEDDSRFRDEMVARSGRQTVPQVFVGDRHLGGCDELFALDRSGELDRLIQGD
jgi:glutaredoxin 3